MTTACAESTSARGTGARRTSTPIPLWTASRNAACTIHPAGSTSGSIEAAAISVAAKAHSASRPRPLMTIPRRIPSCHPW